MRIDATCGDFRTSSLTTRCTTLVPMPKVRPIFRMPSPLARSWRMRLNSRFDRTSAELGAVRPGARKPSADPFPNDAAIKFCEHAEHLKHGLAGGCRRVEALLM